MARFLLQSLTLEDPLANTPLDTFLLRRISEAAARRPPCAPRPKDPLRLEAPPPKGTFVPFKP